MINSSATHHFLKPITIIGAGSWGTALALYLARQNQLVNLVTFNQAHLAQMKEERINRRYFPDHLFPNNLHVVNLQEANVSQSDILIAVPSVGFRAALLALQPLIVKENNIIWATKGIDPTSNQLLHQVAKTILGNERLYGVLSGPSFAKEVVASLPTAIVAASEDLEFAQYMQQRFNSKVFRVYTSTDVTGVEIGGIVKNILAIAAGIVTGMQLGANAASALITRGLAEMSRLGIALGAQAETFTGLAGLGDLVLTCTDNQSRNRRFGIAIGKGKSSDEAMKEIGQVIEGHYNAGLVVSLAKQHHVDMPITETVYRILQNQINLSEALELLLSRSPKTE